MNSLRLAAATLLLCSGVVHAIPTTWALLNEDMTVMGTFSLDIDSQTTSDAQISGDLGFYTISSWTYLNAPGFVGPFAVNNFLKFFSPETGKVYHSDFGGGEYHQIKINDSTIEIGTLAGIMAPGGGVYEAIIHEIYNYDEVNVYCMDYAEIYDPDTGDYIGQGPCTNHGSEAYFNVESGYWYWGYLRSLPQSTAVPTPATPWLMLLGLGALAYTRRKQANDH